MKAIAITIESKYKSKMNKMHNRLKRLENENANLKQQMLSN
jgi:hypothetical protein